MDLEKPDLKSKLDQAWSDWIQPLGLIIVAVVGYGLYKFDLVGERFAGTALVLAVVVGVLLAGIIPAMPMAKRGSNRVLLWLVLAFGLAGAVWPTIHMTISAEPLASDRLTPEKPSVTLTTDREGPYELLVSGSFKQAGQNEVEVGYSLTVEGGGKDEITGDLKRSMHRYRTSRKGGTTASLEERTESVHRLDHVAGHKVTITADSVDEQLDGGLQVGVRSAGPRREIFWTLSVLAVLLALFLDARLVTDIREEDRKFRGPRRELTYLTVVTSMVLVFSINFPMEATPHTLVRAAIGAFFLALLAGGASGWLLAAFARLATRPSRKR